MFTTKQLLYKEWKNFDAKTQCITKYSQMWQEKKLWWKLKKVYFPILHGNRSNSTENPIISIMFAFWVRFRLIIGDSAEVRNFQYLQFRSNRYCKTWLFAHVVPVFFDFLGNFVYSAKVLTTPKISRFITKQ